MEIKNIKKSPFLDDGMHKGAKAVTFANAKALRANLTKAELILWQFLRTKERVGYRFRRQHPLGIYILDFYNHKLKLCIEIDGEYHYRYSQKIKDKEREDFLKFNGIKVIRYKNKEVISDPENIIKNLKSIIEKIANSKPSLP